MSRHERIRKGGDSMNGAQRSQTREPHVLVTGASGGLGAALARHHAALGHRLTLWGRNEERLNVVACSCRALGAMIVTRIVDLQNPTTAEHAYLEDDARDPVDIAIFNAGLSDIRAPDALTEDPERVRALGLVNYVTPSVLATVAAGKMLPRGGRIIMIGSVAAFHDLPFGTAYSGSKAGLARFSTALDLYTRPRGVPVLLVSPGFIDTPMSRRLSGARPFLVKPARAARLIVEASAQGKRHIVFPWPFHVLRIIDMLAPYRLRAALLGSVKVTQSP
jgi:short-subunit dehydrogenase